jgi:hypothetical protein
MDYCKLIIHLHSSKLESTKQIKALRPIGSAQAHKPVVGRCGDKKKKTPIPFDIQLLCFSTYFH